MTFICGNCGRSLHYDDYQDDFICKPCQWEDWAHQLEAERLAREAEDKRSTPIVLPTCTTPNCTNTPDGLDGLHCQPCWENITAQSWWEEVNRSCKNEVA